MKINCLTFSIWAIRIVVGQAWRQDGRISAECLFFTCLWTETNYEAMVRVSKDLGSSQFQSFISFCNMKSGSKIAWNHNKARRNSWTLSLCFFHRSEYEYGFTLIHSSESQAHARGVHVTWMLTPFIKISDVTQSLITGSFRIDQKGDSVTFIVRTFHSTLFLTQRYRNIGNKVTKHTEYLNLGWVVGRIPRVIALFVSRVERGRLGEAAREFLRGKRTCLLHMSLLPNF